MSNDASARAKDYRRLSLWHETCGDDWRPRDGLDGDTVVDVAIVGAGYTGLWTAYWLTELAPGTRIAIVEQEVAGFGASGRNGGFCSALFPTSLRRLAKGSSREAAVALQRTMNDAVGHIGEVVKREGIDCDFEHGGYLSVARNQAQLARVRSSVADLRSWGFGAEHVCELSAAEVAERVRMSDALGGLFSPNCAAVHPAKLVRGLAECVERRGVKIYERTRATTIAPRVVATDRGTVHADVVIRATEGYTADLEGSHRDLVPMYSLMVATRATGPGAVGADRAGREDDLQRRAAPAHLRPAHRRRAICLRGPWRSLPLRVAHFAGLRHRRARARDAANESSPTFSRSSGTWPSPTRGAAASGSPATGTPR